MPTQIWEWRPGGQWTKEIIRRFTVPAEDNTYGDVVDQDLKPPTRTKTFVAHGMTVAEYQTILTAQSRGANYSLTDSMGVSWTGKVLSVSDSGLAGTVLNDVVIQLRLPP